MALSPFDLAEPAQLDASGVPMEVQAPIPEPVPPMVPPPDQAGVLGALQGAPLPQDNAGALQWPDPAWLSPDGLAPPPAQPPVDMPGSPPEQAGPPVDLQGPPVGLAGSPPAPPAPVPTAGEMVPEGATAAQQQTPKGYLGALDANAEGHRLAQEVATQADIDQNNFNSSEGVKNAQNAAAQQKIADDEYLTANKEAKTKRAELDNEAKAIAEQKIDPHRAWHDASFGAKLAFGIAVYMQGAISASSKSGAPVGPSPLMNMLDGICQQDMDAQEKMLANRTGALTMRRGLLADDIAAGKDLQEFRYRSITATYNMAENQIKAYALKYNNPKITATAMDHLATINDAKTEAANKFHHEKVGEWLATRAANQADRGLDIQQQNADTAKATQEAKGTETSAATQRLEFDKNKDQRERIVPGGKMADGTQLYAKDKDVATKVNTKMAGANKGAAAIAELTEIYKKHEWQPMGGWSLDEDARNDFQRANTLLQDVMTNFSLEKGQGTIRDAEYDRYEKMIGKPGAFIDPTQGSLAAMHDLFVNDVNDTLKYEVDTNSAYWTPTNHYKAPSFDKKGLPINQPGAAGLPAKGVDPGHDPKVSPATQEFIDSGKFTPATKDPTGQGYLDYVGGG